MITDSITTKRKISFIIGILSSVFFGYYALQDFDWIVLKKILITIDPLPLFFAFLANLIVYVLKAFRWKYFLPKDFLSTFKSRFSGVAIGYLFLSFMPMRLGDLIRPVYLAKLNRQLLRDSIVSVFIEKYYEAVTVFLLALFLLKFIAIPNLEILSINFTLLSLGTIFGIGFLFFARPISQMATALFRAVRLKFIATKLNTIIKSFEINFRIVRIVFLFGLTTIILFFDGLVFVFILKAMSTDISFFDCYLVMLITTLTNFIPSAPASVGVYHYFCRLGLTVFGISSAKALSAAVIIHAFFFVFQVFIGIICIFWGPLKLNDILKGQQVKSGEITNLEPARKNSKLVNKY